MYVIPNILLTKSYSPYYYYKNDIFIFEFYFRQIIKKNHYIFNINVSTQHYFQNKKKKNIRQMKNSNLSIL